MKTIYFFCLYIISSSLLFSETDALPCAGNTEECAKINEWFLEGSAAGNVNDYYDNRDKGHSLLNLKHFPQLNQIQYSEAEKIAKHDWAGQRRLIPEVTIGNSSTAGQLGSNARAFYYTSQEGMDFLYNQYRENNLYIYPAVGDYQPTPKANSEGSNRDLLPTNSPYLILSQGRSGSDRPFLDAFIRTLASFKPKVKEKLVETGMLMPTLQQIFRMSNSQVQSTSDYLSGKAHVPAFRGEEIQKGKMMQLAHEMTLETIPPLVVLEEVDSTYSPLYLENLSSTPSVISKIYRGQESSKTLTVTAENSVDINNYPLKYHWILLSGNEKGVKIEPTNNGEIAKITVDYQPSHFIDRTTGFKSNRIDIGVFADNGRNLSPPAFITIYSLPNELRTYTDDKKLKEVYHADKSIGFEIQSWKELLKVLNNADDSFPSKILKEKFTDDEISYLVSISDDITEKEFRLQQAIKQLQTLQAQRQKLGKGTVPWSDIHQADLAMNAAQRAFMKFLNTPRNELNNKSIKEVVSNSIQSSIDDDNFYNNNRIIIGDLLAKQSAKKTIKSFNTLKKKLALSKKLNKKPSKYGELLDKEFNLFILSEIMFPESIRYWKKDNYVDPRIVEPSEHIEEYIYDDEGQLIKISKKRI